MTVCHKMSVPKLLSPIFGKLSHIITKNPSPSFSTVATMARPRLQARSTESVTGISGAGPWPGPLNVSRGYPKP